MKYKRTIPGKLMAEFSHFLVDAIGFDFPEERWNELEKKFLLVMKSFGFLDPESCIQWLKKNPLNKEVIAFLAHHLTIGETYFFRDPLTFASLENHVFPELFQRHQKDRHIRIWCVGCCSGEEPYSLAIILNRMLWDFKNWNISIMGSDINEEFLRKAEQGCYKKWSFRAVPPEIIDKYFTKQPDATYQLIPEIKKRVKFTYLNLAEDNYINSANDTTEMDLILCHNVLIYFSKKQIQKIIGQLTTALKDQGWLSVSAIEVPFINDERLTPYNFSGTVLFKKELKKTSKEETLKNYTPLAKTPLSTKAKEEPSLKARTPPLEHSSHHPDIHRSKNPIKTAHSITNDPLKRTLDPHIHIDRNFYEKCLQLSQQKKYEEVISELLAFLSPYLKDANALRHHLKEMTLLIHMYANQGNLPLAIKWCEEVLKLDKLDPKIHYLHATILHASGDTQTAIKSLTRTLFLDPNFVAAHYMLGLLEQQQRNDKNAFRSLQTALELVENYQADDILPGTDELTAGRLKDILMSMLER